MKKDSYYYSFKKHMEREERKEAIKEMLGLAFVFALGLVAMYLFMLVMPD